MNAETVQGRDPASPPSSCPYAPGSRRFSIGNLVRRLRDTTGLFADLHRRHGKIAAYRVMSKRFCAIYDTALSEEVVVKKRTLFVKGAAQRRAMENVCIITADGDDHLRRRKLVQPSFTPKALRGYAELMATEAFRLQGSWRDGEEVDVAGMTNSLALTVAIRCFFGDDISVSREMVVDALRGYRWRVMLGLLPFNEFFKALPLPGSLRARRDIQRLDNAIYEAVDRARENGDRTDLISHLVRARDEDGVFEPLTKSELKDEAFAILVAGHDTTGAAMAWCLYHLSRNPDKRRKLEDEVDALLGDALPTYDDFGRLAYTRAVVDESLRLTPPTAYLGRTAVDDVVIGGYRIDKGTTVQPSIRIPMRRADYFEEPERFKPERWLEVPQPKRPKFAYAPFGVGTRFCSGFRFALMELVLSLALFARSWRIDVIADDLPEVRDMIIYKFKHGLPATVTRRGAVPGGERPVSPAGSVAGSAGSSDGAASSRDLAQFNERSC